MYVVWDHVGWKWQNKTLTINAQRLPLSCHTESLWAFFIDNDAEVNHRVFYDAIKFASCRRNSMNSSMGNGSLDSCEFPSQNVAPSLKPHLHMEAKNVEFEWKSFSVAKVRTRVRINKGGLTQPSVASVVLHSKRNRILSLPRWIAATASTTTFVVDSCKRYIYSIYYASTTRLEFSRAENMRFINRSRVARNYIKRQWQWQWQ